MLKRLRNYFLTGLIVILPAIVTIAILRFLIVKLNLLLLEPITRIFPVLKLSPYLENTAKLVAFILVVLSIILIGLATKIIIVRNLLHLLEKILTKVPMVNKIYVATKQLSHAFLGNQIKIFEKVALIEYPRKGVYSIGLVAAQTGGEISKKMNRQQLFNIFIPTSPNPTSGIFLIAPKEELTFLEMSVEEALKLIISVGKILPPNSK
jgi:uncharacterized membrane protein